MVKGGSTYSAEIISRRALALAVGFGAAAVAGAGGDFGGVWFYLLHVKPVYLGGEPSRVFRGRVVAF